MGLEMPLAVWVRGPLRNVVGDLLHLEGPPGFLNRKGVERLFEQHLRGVQDWSRQLWSLLVMKLWYQKVVRDQAVVQCWAS
jgi:asparagine synthase (glutamine-hydrolysing)